MTHPVLKGACPALAPPRPGVMPVSNLWCCMSRAGKRGRRTSAGSLDSNLEVSRKRRMSGLFSAHDVHFKKNTTQRTKQKH